MPFLSEFASLILAGVMTVATVATGNTVLIQEGRVVEDDLYASGGTIFIEGEINGDLVALGQRVIITGVVHGDVTTISGTTSIFGEVDGSVRTLSLTYSQNGPVGDDVLMLGGRAHLDDSVGGDAIFYSWSADARADVGGSVLGEVLGTLLIDGQVGSVDAGAFRMRVGPGASSSGAVAHNPGLVATYIPGVDSVISVDPEAQVATVIDLPIPSPPLVVRSGRWAIGTLLFLSTVLTGALFVGLYPAWTRRSVSRVLRPGSIALGLVALLFAPVLAFLMALTVVLLPVAVISLAFWAVMIIGGGTPVLIRTGTMILKRPDAMVAGLALGALLWRVLQFVPLLGPVLWLLVVAAGTGSFLTSMVARATPASLTEAGAE